MLPGVDPTTTTISLELRLSGDSLEGAASSPDGTRREFTGWIGLMSALDALLPPAALDGLPSPEHLAAGAAPSPTAPAAEVSSTPIPPKENR